MLSSVAPENVEVPVAFGAERIPVAATVRLPLMSRTYAAFAPRVPDATTVVVIPELTVTDCVVSDFTVPPRLRDVVPPPLMENVLFPVKVRLLIAVVVSLAPSFRLNVATAGSRIGNEELAAEIVTDPPEVIL